MASKAIGVAYFMDAAEAAEVVKIFDAINNQEYAGLKKAIDLTKALETDGGTNIDPYRDAWALLSICLIKDDKVARSPSCCFLSIESNFVKKIFVLPY